MTTTLDPEFSLHLPGGAQAVWWGDHGDLLILGHGHEPAKLIRALVEYGELDWAHRDEQQRLEASLSECWAVLGPGDNTHADKLVTAGTPGATPVTHLCV